MLLTTGRIGVFVFALITAASPAFSQTDYYNTDAGRPLTVEDAYPTERYAFELQIAPLRLERAEGGIYQWGIEPEIAYGIFPRTHIEIGAPLSYVDVGGGRRTSGLAGLDLSLLHNLNAETSIPALAVVGSVLLPVGSLAPDRAYVSAKGIATRTMPWARFHLNGEYTFGENAESFPTGSNAAGRPEVARWLAGLAADKTFPLRSMLVGAEVFARQPLESDEAVAWNAAAGIRYQLTPYFNIDGGLGKQLSGDDRSWFFTFGLSRAFSIRSLFPTR